MGMKGLGHMRGIGSDGNGVNTQKILQNESNSLLLNHLKQLLEKGIKRFP